MALSNLYWQYLRPSANEIRGGLCVVTSLILIFAASVYCYSDEPTSQHANNDSQNTLQNTTDNNDKNNDKNNAAEKESKIDEPKIDEPKSNSTKEEVQKVDDKKGEPKNNLPSENDHANGEVGGWRVPKPKEIRRELESWLSSADAVDENVRRDILSLWGSNPLNLQNPTQDSTGNEQNAPIKDEFDTDIVVDIDEAELGEQNISGEELLERTIESMRRANNHIADYLKRCDDLAWQELPYGQKLVTPQIPLQIHLGKSSSSQYLHNSLKFYLAIKLVQGRFYDEAIKILEELRPEDCVNPAELLINRAIIYSSLSMNKEGQSAINAFNIVAKNDSTVPRRYVELAKLIEFDMKKEADPKNPQQISKKMDNARRKLGKGDTDEDTQKAEKDVLESLEKLIEEVEKQAKKSCKGDGKGEGDITSDNHAEDSEVLRGKAPGNVDRKEFNAEGNWGGLPPKEREAALSKIEREFPAHYRDIIENYFREMAAGDEGKK
ncbi:MAG: hypothetical protein LBQ66_15685 [Planctomycetaceae bacterium]|jgi:hypothetical protein|nr:hypothetical protein [Planctomycetaceae bacterium]